MNRPEAATATQHGTALHLQIARFGAVGLAATTVHALIYLGLTRAALTALAANTAGFAAAFGLSFLGHRRWTFAHHSAELATALPRFIATALVGFASNTLITWLLVECAGLPPASALAGILLITPALLFLLSKHWAFAAPTT